VELHTPCATPSACSHRWVACAKNLTHANKCAETNELLPIAKLGAETDRWSTRATDPKSQQIPLVSLSPRREERHRRSYVVHRGEQKSTYSIAVFVSIRLQIQRRPSAGARLCSLSSFCFLPPVRMLAPTTTVLEETKTKGAPMMAIYIWPVSLSIQKRFRRCS
jgi:hypothetical protein